MVIPVIPVILMVIPVIPVIPMVIPVIPMVIPVIPMVIPIIGDPKFQRNSKNFPRIFQEFFVRGVNAVPINVSM